MNIMIFKKITDKFRKWLFGEIQCIKCKQYYYFHSSFGYGKCICPKCYASEKRFIFLDDEFILNRALVKIGEINDWIR